MRPRERRDSDNPNGWDPIFDGSIVHGNDFLEQNNVTYQDLINKPIQFKILIQGKCTVVSSLVARFSTHVNRVVRLYGFVAFELASHD